MKFEKDLIMVANYLQTALCSHNRIRKILKKTARQFQNKSGIVLNNHNISNK